MLSRLPNLLNGSVSLHVLTCSMQAEDALAGSDTAALRTKVQALRMILCTLMVAIFGRIAHTNSSLTTSAYLQTCLSFFSSPLKIVRSDW